MILLFPRQISLDILLAWISPIDLVNVDSSVSKYSRNDLSVLLNGRYCMFELFLSSETAFNRLKWFSDRGMLVSTLAIDRLDEFDELVPINFRKRMILSGVKILTSKGQISATAANAFSILSYFPSLETICIDSLINGDNVGNFVDVSNGKVWEFLKISNIMHPKILLTLQRWKQVTRNGYWRCYGVNLWL